MTHNPGVVGSSPTGPTFDNKALLALSWKLGNSPT